LVQWNLVKNYHKFLSNLLCRWHISSIGKCLPSSDIQTYFSPRFFRIRENEEKKTLSKELLSCEKLLRCILTKWAKKRNERKIPKQNLWILIDMKKTKTCSKTRKNKQQWYIIVWQTNFFAFCFLLKKWPPWQFYLDHCDK